MRKKFLGMVLALTLCVSTIAPSSAYAGTGTQKESTKTTYTVEKEAHGTTAFDDITYKRPDFKATKADIKKISQLMKKDGQYTKIKKLLEKINNDMNGASTMATYLTIMCSKDVTNNDTLKEKNLVVEEMSNISKLYYETVVQLFESKYGAKIKKTMTDDEIKAIYKNHETFSDEFIKVQTEISTLCAEYEKVLNTTTANVNGKDMTLVELSKNVASLSTEDYNKYYSLIYKTTNEKAAEIYLKLVDAYKKKAKLAGSDNFTDYMYDQYDRDYTKEQASQFAEYVKENIVPLYLSLASSMTVDDVNKINSVSGSLDQFESRFKKYFASINPNMLDAYNYLHKYNLCDFKATPVKQQLNYTTILHDFNEPYITLYPYGNFTDVSQFVHEFGHFYAYYTHGTKINQCLDILEIHSQTDELLFMPNYSIYGDAYEPVVKYQILIKLKTMIDGCLYDEFQQKVYAGNYTTVKDLNELFFKLQCEYGYADPSMGTEGYEWTFVPHNFELPCYYISYALSVVPALEIYTQSLTDRKAAIASYNRVIKLGTADTFTNTLVKAHLRSPFSDYTLSSLADRLYDEYNIKNTAEAVKPAA